MQVSWQTLVVHTTAPFGIARWTKTDYPRTIVTLTDGEYAGRGEAAPNAYYGETRETVEAVLPLLTAGVTDPWDWDGLRARMDAVLPQGHPSAKCAVEMAAVEWCARSVGVPAYRLLGLPAGPIPQSSYTIGLAELPAMQQRARDAVAQGHRVLKVKLGTDHDEQIVAALRQAAPEVALRVDANAAWTRARAKRMLAVLAEAGVELVEQPLAADDLAGHAELRRQAQVPIVADESLHAAGDVVALADAFDGVNLKLAKLGGPLQALHALRLARAHHLQVMIGCMIETSLGIAAAASLAPLADWADLDGALLLADDPVPGLTWQAGQLTRPECPGWLPAP